MVPGAPRFRSPLLATGIVQGQIPVRRRSARIHQRPLRGPTANHRQRTEGEERSPPVEHDCRVCDLRGGHCRHGGPSLVPDRIHLGRRWENRETHNHHRQRYYT